MAGNWAEISPVKYGLRSMKFLFRIRVQITSIPYTSGPEAPAPSSSCHKANFCRADSGDGRSFTRIPVSRVNCCNSCSRAALNVLVVHSSKRVNVTGAWIGGLAQACRRKESNTKQIGRTNLAELGQPTQRLPSWYALFA